MDAVLESYLRIGLDTFDAEDAIFLHALASKGNSAIDIIHKVDYVTLHTLMSTPR